MKPIVAISLKMYFDRARTLSYIRTLTGTVAQADYSGIQLAVLPDFLTIWEAAGILDGSGLLLGAQDICQDDRGAFTGEVSGADLAELGVALVELGHAERRTIYGEDDALVAAKFAATVRNGMIPLLCIGEAQRSDADQAAQQCLTQIQAVAGDVLPEQVWFGYEPYWAIGAAQPAPVEHVQQVCTAIRAGLGEQGQRAAILYGGSAGPGLLTKLGDSVDGLFLGRFAHNPEAFFSVAAEALAR